MVQKIVPKDFTQYCSSPPLCMMISYAYGYSYTLSLERIFCLLKDHYTYNLYTQYRAARAVPAGPTPGPVQAMFMNHDSPRGAPALDLRCRVGPACDLEQTTRARVLLPLLKSARRLLNVRGWPSRPHCRNACLVPCRFGTRFSSFSRI